MVTRWSPAINGDHKQFKKPALQSFLQNRFHSYIQLDSNQMYNWHKYFVQTQIIVHVPYYKRRKKKKEMQVHQTLTFILCIISEWFTIFQIIIYFHF